MKLTKKKTVVLCMLGIFLLAAIGLCKLTAENKKAYAASTQTYTLTFSGTFENWTYGYKGSKPIENETIYTIMKDPGAGTLDISLYVSGYTSKSGGTLSNDGYIDFSGVKISCSVPTFTISLYNTSGKLLAQKQGEISTTLSDGKYKVALQHRVDSGSGYTKWGYDLQIESYFNVDTQAPVLTGASISTDGKYTNDTFTVTTSDTGSGVNVMYMRSPNETRWVYVGNTSKTVYKGAENGQYAFYAMDKAGNRSAYYYVNYDDTAPKLTCTGAKFGSVSETGFTVSAEDNMTDVTLYYKYENENWKNVGTQYTVNEKNSEDGTYYFYAVDKVNNKSDEFWVTLSTKEPSGTFIKSDSDNTVYFTWNGAWTATLDGKAYTKETWITAEGNHTIILSSISGKRTVYPFSIDHYFIPKETIAPTCTEQGYTVYRCKQCNTEEKRDYIAAAGHKYVTAIVPPTCTESEAVTYTCEICGFEYKESGELPSGHVYNSRILKSPSCTTAGEREFTCEKCGDTYTSEIPATGHDYIIINVEVEDGKTLRTYACKICGANYVQDLGDQSEYVTSYVEYLFDLYSPYMIWVFLATAGIWSIVLGVMIILAHRNEEREKAKKMLVNYLIGLVVIFAIVVACPFLVNGIAALVT